MQSFIIAINAVVPFMIYILLGYGVKSIGWADEKFFKKMNSVVFKTFFPIMMFSNVYTKDRDIHVEKKLLLAAIVTLFLLLAVLLAVVPRIVKDKATTGVIIQGIYRSNTVLFAIPLMENMYGENGLAIATVLIAIMVPIYNAIAVFILEYYGESTQRKTVKNLIMDIITNPIISGTLVGAIFYFLRIPLPKCVLKPISQFAAMTTPLALFILGGTLRFKSMLAHAKYIIPTVAIKASIVPAVMLAIAYAFHFGPIERFAIFCLYGTPVAASSYSMAESMNCNGELAGELVVAGTSFSVLSIFLWIFFMNTFGML